MLILFGSVMFLVCLAPLTRFFDAIDISFTVEPGDIYGEYLPGAPTAYWTKGHSFYGKSVLIGEVIVEGDGIYLTGKYNNTEHLKDIFIKWGYSFTIDPASDFYVFTFDNTQGYNENSVKFKLIEKWLGPALIGSVPIFFIGTSGFFVFLSGVIRLILKLIWKEK